MSPTSEASFTYHQLPNGWEVGGFAVLDEYTFLVHAVTTRKGPDPQMVASDAAATATATANLVRDALSLSQIAWCHQVHGPRVLEAIEGGPVGAADAMVTDVRSLGLMVRSADCPLILAVDPVRRAIGVGHASWRSTVSRIASKLVETLADRFGVRPGDVIACICPSAGPCCYEVGPEVRTAAINGIGAHAEQFFPQRGGKLYFDLWAANREQLIRGGVRPENIHIARECTICHNAHFPSYRAEGEAAGRFAAVLALA